MPPLGEPAGQIIGDGCGAQQFGNSPPLRGRGCRPEELDTGLQGRAGRVSRGCWRGVPLTAIAA